MSRAYYNEIDPYAAQWLRNLIAAGHSRKPDQMHDDLERLFPGPRCELFARERRPGWDCWGNETGKFGEAVE